MFGPDKKYPGELSDSKLLTRIHNMSPEHIFDLN